jgi:hypothetical protein
MPKETWEVKYIPMDTRVVWLRDMKTKERWCVDRQKVPTIERIRLFCERDQRYVEFPDRSPGFLKLLFNNKPL